MIENIQPEMDVCDLDGDRVGTVVAFHRVLVGAATTAGPAAAAESGEITREDIVEVKTGFLGLKHLFIPISAVQEVNGPCVYLTVRKSELEHGDWGTRPSYIEDLG